MDIERIALKHALNNALQHGGKAQEKAVIGKVVAEVGDKSKIGDIVECVRAVVKRVNSMSIREIESALKEFGGLERKAHEEREQGLPELPNVGDMVVMRFAPGPSGPLHIGHARAAILNDEYVKRYGGKYILRIEDTNPRKIVPEAYDMIPEDLDWLGVKYHETHVQSDRFPIYYEHAENLIKMGKAYICLCRAEEWRKMKLEGRPCPHRNMGVEHALELWEKMLNGEFGEGEASYVVKTSLSHPNPALRDFVGFRILYDQHPRTGDKYCVYPLYNFSVAIDDALMGMTHVLRGKDHLNNTYRQHYIFDYFGWKKPEYIHYGLVSIEDITLKTSKILEGIKGGYFLGWEDVRLGTLRALARRGIRPEAIRKLWISVGIKDVDIKFSWENLYAINREIVDANAHRLFFIPNPKTFRLFGAPEYTASVPRHPSRKEFGDRRIVYKCVDGKGWVIIPGADIADMEKGTVFRLKDFCNVELVGDEDLRFHSMEVSALPHGAKKVQWLPAGYGEKMVVHMPSGEVVEGIVERGVENYRGKIVQFERFGFVRINGRDCGRWIAYFAHR